MSRKIRHIQKCKYRLSKLQNYIKESGITKLLEWTPLQIKPLGQRLKQDLSCLLMYSRKDFQKEFSILNGKKLKLILIPILGKTLGEPQDYRPICFLDTVAKCLERIIYKRLQLAVDKVNGFSHMQYGFRKTKSPVNAINLVVNSAKIAIQGRGTARKYCAIVMLDIKSA